LRISKYSIESTDSMLLPNVLFVGPQKTGTTWIYEYLRSRGDIVLPDGVKETWFFSHFFDRGLGWYGTHFQPLKSFSCVVEVDPTLFSHREAMKRVSDVLGLDILIICTLRDPIKRSISHYRHARRYGWTNKPFQQAINEVPAILDDSRYTKHLQRWIAMFGRDRVHILFQEELARNADGFIDHLCHTMKIQNIAVQNQLRSRVNEAMVPRFLPFSWLVSKISTLRRAVRRRRPSFAG